MTIRIEKTSDEIYENKFKKKLDIGPWENFYNICKIFFS